jgi:hypothetical protein
VHKIQRGKNITKGKNFTRRQKHHHDQQQISTIYATLQTHNRLWYEAPDMGLEAFVATIRSKKKLHEALVNELMKKRAHAAGHTNPDRIDNNTMQS